MAATVHKETKQLLVVVASLPTSKMDIREGSIHDEGNSCPFPPVTSLFHMK